MHLRGAEAYWDLLVMPTTAPVPSGLSLSADDTSLRNDALAGGPSTSSGGKAKGKAKGQGGGQSSKRQQKSKEWFRKVAAKKGASKGKY